MTAITAGRPQTLHVSRTAGSQDTGSTTIAIPAQGCVLDGKDKCPDDVFYNLDATHAISCADAKRCTVRSALAVRSSWSCIPTVVEPGGAHYPLPTILLVLLPTVCTAPSVQRAVRRQRVFVSSDGCGFAMAPSGASPSPRAGTGKSRRGGVQQVASRCMWLHTVLRRAATKRRKGFAREQA